MFIAHLLYITFKLNSRKWQIIGALILYIDHNAACIYFSPSIFSHIQYRKTIPIGPIMKNNCTNLYFLSTIACQLTECLDEKELELLSADLTTLGYMIESLLAHQSVCKDE